MDNAIRAHRVTLVHANERRALDSVELSIRRGERVAVIGPSGAGKTSLLRVFGTAVRPNGGALDVLGADPWALGDAGRRRLRGRLGLVHQSPPLPPRQRVVTAVLAGRLGRWSLARAMVSLAYPIDIVGAREALARLDLADRLFDRCDRLSGGQAQRVGVARVLYQAPELILADEPVSALDPTLANRTVAVLIAESLVRGITLVASLHAVDLALAHFPRIVGLRNGKVLFDSPTPKVDADMLEALYAQEGFLPTQHGKPITLPDLRLARPPQCT